ncbi:hypothetical protein CLS_15230 [[Clostridium] cf. saccharolyticum K10]|nr:hypothetical protein CLS_15230 [[Clostridium] cf. saccharolyticum K10]
MLYPETERVKTSRSREGNYFRAYIWMKEPAAAETEEK